MSQLNRSRDQSGAPRGVASIIIPCYNAEAFVSETIESALQQTYSPVEVIVVDDASQDASWQRIQQYAPRIRAERLSTNRGGSHARNRGVELATGDYLLFLDSDDTLAPETVAELVAALSGIHEGIAVSPWVELRRDGGGTWREREADVPGLSSEPGRALEQWMSGESWAPPCAVLWSRGAYQRTGGWDEALTYNDDGDLVMRGLLAGAEFVLSGRGKAYYRCFGEDRVSVSANLFSELKVTSALRVFEKLEAQLRDRALIDEYRVPLGTGYQRVALIGFQHGHSRVAREALHRGTELCGLRPVSPTRVGRILERIVGLEQKEKVARVLGSVRVMTRERRLRAKRAKQFG